VNGGFQVNRDSLQQASRIFEAESGSFAAIMPMDGTRGVNAGSALINAAISQMLEAIGGLHTQMAAVIGEHGAKLTTAAANYQEAEDATTDRIRAVGLGS
jgi:Family of unknown function (DUF6317)